MSTVKNMLGLADRQQSGELYEQLLGGDVAAVLQTLQKLYVNGATPMLVLQDLIEITHMAAKVKVLPDFINDASLSEADRELCKKLSGAPISILSKIWQMLIKGLSELQYATVQIDALEMILMRIAYSAALPTPAALLEELKKKSSLKNNTQTGQNGAFVEAAATGVVINTTDDLLQLMTAKKVPMLMFAIKNDISFKSFEFGHIHIAVSEKAEKDLIYNFRKFLEAETGISWKIDIDYEPLGETLAFIEARELNRDKKNISEYPLVKAILNEFNGAKIETIIRKQLEKSEDEEPVEFAAEETTTEIYED